MLHNHEQIRALRKIKKCFALASSCNANESSIAFKQAQKLAKQYCISDMDLELIDVIEIECRTGQSGFPSNWNAALSNLIDKAFGTEHLFRTYNDYSSIVFVGNEKQVAIAEYCYLVLKRKLVKARKNYYKSTRGKRYDRIKRSDIFALSWVNSISKTVNQFANSPEQKNKLIRYMYVNHSNLKDYESRQSKLTNENSVIRAMQEGSQQGSQVSLFHSVSTKGQHYLQVR